MLTIAMSMFASCTQQNEQNIFDECIRIHIRANSNSEQDQAVKLKVRDSITSYLSVMLKDCKDKQDAVNTLNKLKQNLVNIANNTLYLNNFTYKASIVLNRDYFPAKAYGEYIFPEGEYDALIIYLGQGVGDNWWCVAFPPLCFIPSNDGEDRIVYKSWVKELLDKIFN